MRIGTLIVGTRSWIEIDLAGIAGRGRVVPRLIFSLTMRTPNERSEAELHDVRIQLLVADELVGEGRVIGERAASFGNSCQIEVEVSRKALGYVTERLGTQSAIDLTLRWYGLLRVRWQPGTSDSRSAADPEPGEWTLLHLADRQHECHLRIPRSDWFNNVLQPIGDGDVLHLEVMIPRGLEARHWTKTLDRLAEAEKCYALGDDAGVFAKLKGAFEALPGSPKNIFDLVQEPRRTEVDKLVKAFVADYINHGRHVSKDGFQAGEFPVDHVDAGFALNTAKVILSYASRIIGQTPTAQ
ncbi:MAG: hypothetical protein M3256_26560 [Actinomycetota bacterium]|nr:hypothetical protein [Actinomycetota bacterium]